MVNSRKTRKAGVKRTLVLLALLAIVGLSPTTAALAFQVPELPPDNLINNPWFRRASDPTRSGLDGWTDAAGLDQVWSSSQKESNPSADLLVAGPCGNQQTYCGTAARLSPNSGQSGGVGQAGADAYLYQVVGADKTHRKLKFFTHWVSHQISADITIYGSNSSSGDWTPVWVPFNYVQESSPPPPRGGQAELWTQTDFLETVIAEGYPFYKIEIHAVLTDTNSTGFKLTGIYFATELTSDPADPAPLLPSPVPQEQISTPLPTSRSRTPVWTATSLPEATPSPTVTPDIRPTRILPTALTPTETLAPINPSDPGTGGSGFLGSLGISPFWGGVLLGVISVGVLLLLILTIASMLRRRGSNP